MTLILYERRLFIDKSRDTLQTQWKRVASFKNEIRINCYKTKTNRDHDRWDYKIENE